ncbi:hypothetical protein E2562_030229 [Oryza meyeriana var. granulata]|uniref:Uncharacterized protein n=1 Tax=Oryza meyeriana var. granulata TaxID=110450 RepID=A0A6G1DB11_9ORYZ|nr:hypothetical protein E2562_030229 [Oryza meyeriana var. granulata]
MNTASSYIRQDGKRKLTAYGEQSGQDAMIDSSIRTDHRRREETMERRRSTSEQPKRRRREREVEISVADRFAALPDGVLAGIVSKLS